MQREDVELRVRGEIVAGWLYRPPEGAGPFPAVLLMHGFTATRDEQLDRYCELFAGSGIASLAIDFRHFGASGGEPRQLLDVKRQYEDCDAALAWLRDHDA